MTYRYDKYWCDAGLALIGKAMCWYNTRRAVVQKPNGVVSYGIFFVGLQLYAVNTAFSVYRTRG